MYMTVRMIIVCIVLLCSVLLIKKTAIARKRMMNVISACVSAVLLLGLAFLPFENLFLTFDSPEAAYKYYCFGGSDIKMIVDGNDCALVVDRKDRSDTYLIVPKCADGWRIGVGSDTNMVARNVSESVIVYVYQYKNTDDYFITVLDTKNETSNVSDDRNSEFVPLISSDGRSVTYFTHVSGPLSQYNIIVNGNKIAL